MRELWDDEWPSLVTGACIGGLLVNLVWTLVVLLTVTR